MKSFGLVFAFMIAGLLAQSQTSCPGFKTFTQGGWGANPSGNNVGTFLDQNFAANFPSPTYLTIGCTNKLQLTSAAAVRAFLPNGTIPAVLPAGTSVNKTKSNFSNVLAGQLVALTLNLRFDNNIPSFGPSTTNLKDLVIASGPFMGKTVQFLYDNANLIIGGCSGYFPKTLSEYTTAIDNVNKNYDNGSNTSSFLVCPLKTSCNTNNVLCKGDASGSMTVSTTGGLAPFTYTWTVPSGYTAVGNVASASGLKAGTYSVSVRDAVGQTSTTSCTITEPATAVSASDNHSNVSCFGGSNGSVTLTFSGGTGAFMVKLDEGSFTTKTSPAVFSNLSAGNHTWSVKDANGCTVSGDETIDQPTAVVANDAHTDVLCKSGSSGSITLTFSGGTPGYTVDFNGSGDVSQTSSKTYADLAAGDYSWTVKDANGCSVSGSETVSEPATAVSASDDHSNVSCFGGSNGSVTLTFSGGTGAFMIKFDEGSFETKSSPAVYANLSAGSHPWSVIDANGCTVSGDETIEEPTALSASATHTDLICKGDNGGIVNITMSGGTPDYNISFNGGAEETKDSPASYESLTAGSYTWSVKDANGCSVSGTETVSEPSSPCYTECRPLKTFTQGGWGAVPRGGNPGVYLHANFSAAFPSGITLGCTNTISFTSAQAITDWLPSGTTPAALPAGSMVNPTSYNNVLAAQLLAATLSTGFDAYDANFSNGNNGLGSMYYGDLPFAGMTVNQLLVEANNSIGGCGSTYSYADLNAALTNINENYDNGTVDKGHLTCSNPSSRVMTNASKMINAKVFPNPASTEATLSIEGISGEIATIYLYDVTGRSLMIKKLPLISGMNQYRINVSKIENQTCVVKVSAGNRTSTSRIIIQH